MKESQPIRCLIVQLARFSDTLQSLMALRAAQQLYPQLEITFIVRERFADAARRVPWLKNVVVFPSDEILGPVVQGASTEKEALKKIAGWIRPLVQEPWDIVLNWSYSEPSSYLTGLIPARVKLGYSRSRDTLFSCPDGWSHYIQAVIQGGIHQNIHLTDVLTTQLLTALQIHVGEPADNGDAPVTSKNFFSLPTPSAHEHTLGDRWRDRSKKWIAIQLGAGSDQKIWAPGNWAKLVEMLLSRHPDYGILLLGGKEDLERANHVILGLQRKGLNGSVLSLVGKSDFELWAAAVSRAHWLISGETAAIHLASVLGTRVLNLAIGSSRWNETGPYGNGHYIVVPSKPTGTIPPEIVYATWLYATQDSSVRKSFGSGMKDVRVFRSRIRSSTDGGGVTYEGISQHPLELNDWTSMVMGHIARAWYCGWVPTTGQEISRSAITPDLIQSLRELDQSAAVLTKICNEATRTATHLTRHSAKLRSQKIMHLRDREEIQKLGTKLEELDDLIERLGKTHAPLQAFSKMSKVLLHNLKSTKLSELGRETSDCYRQLLEGVNILREWIRFTQDLARPVAIRSEPRTLIAVPAPSSPRDSL